MTNRRPRLALVYDRIYPLLNGGGERRFYEIGRRLAAEFDVAFFYYGQGADPAHYPNARAVGVGGRVPMYTRGGRRSILQSVDFARRLGGPLSAFKPSLIDCSSVSYASIPVCALAAVRAHASVVITWHEYWGRYWSQYLSRGTATMAHLFERALPRLASANVAVSTFTAERLRKGTGTRAYVIPNGIDMSAISAAKPSSKSTDIIFVGRLMREKRVALLLDAVRMVSLSVPNVHVEIIGDGPERYAIGELARDLPANVRVDLVSRIADETELYCRIKSSKMLVLPSEREGYGLVVAEAQACGTVPIVVRGTENASLDLIEPGHTGIIVEANRDELARAILMTMRDPEARKRIGERARTSSPVRDWQHSAAATAALYQALLSRTGNYASRCSIVTASWG